MPTLKEPVILFPIREATMKKKEERRDRGRQRLYDSQTFSVNEEEKLLFEVLAMHEGMKPATLARRLVYMGVALFLKDRQLRLPKPEMVLQEDLVKLVETDPALKTIKEILERQPSRSSKKEPEAKRRAG
jgi:hypothetical protein